MLGGNCRAGGTCPGPGCALHDRHSTCSHLACLVPSQCLEVPSAAFLRTEDTGREGSVASGQGSPGPRSGKHRPWAGVARLSPLGTSLLHWTGRAFLPRWAQCPRLHLLHPGSSSLFSQSGVGLGSTWEDIPHLGFECSVLPSLVGVGVPATGSQLLRMSGPGQGSLVRQNTRAAGGDMPPP